MSKAEWAWAAGLFEGEGHVRLIQNKYPRIALMSTDEDVVRRFHTVLGIGNVTGPYDRGARRKPAWQFTAQKKDEVMAALTRLRPWLGQRRAAQVDAAIGGL